MKRTLNSLMLISGLFLFFSCDSDVTSIDQVAAETRTGECYHEDDPFCAYDLVNCTLTGSNSSTLNLDPDCEVFTITLENVAPPGSLCLLSQEEQDNYFIVLQRAIDAVKAKLAAQCDPFGEYPVIPVHFAPSESFRFDMIMYWACCPV